jgi:hypothetical protein
VKNALLIICALGYGLLPAAAGFESPFVLLVPVLFGLIYFVLHRHDFGGPLLPWLFACVTVGRVAAYWWLNLKHARQGSLVDQEVWVFGGLAAVTFAFTFWKWISRHNESPASASPKSN